MQEAVEFYREQECALLAACQHTIALSRRDVKTLAQLPGDPPISKGFAVLYPPIRDDMADLACVPAAVQRRYLTCNVR